MSFVPMGGKTLGIQIHSDRHIGRAQFREGHSPVGGSELARLSELRPASRMQFRRSPVGFRFDFHCSPKRSGCSSLAAMEI